MTKKILIALLGCLLASSCVRMPLVERPAFSFLRTDGSRTVDESGASVVLKGCNLGNWFLLEMWMMDVRDVRDQYEFESVLASRFGQERKDALMETYRANWISERDFEIIPTFGFNAVRLPFHYSLLMDDEHPLVLKAEAFKWLDAAVGMAKRNGLYVILDLHGVPGGQSTDHTTGRENQNRLWTSDEYKKQTIWLWKQLAEHYRDEPVVAAYDVINEPFGDSKTLVHEPALVGLMGDLYAAIRSIDPRHIIILAGTRAGIGCYGKPSDRGWTNVMFTEHYYPGVMGSGSGLEAHGKHVNQNLPYLERLFNQWGTPLLVGEFNVVFQRAGGAQMMRQYYDLYGSNGWWATMWSYKLVTSGGRLPSDPWCMVCNAQAAPHVSIRSSTYEAIDAYFKWFGTTDYAVYEALRQAMTTNSPAHLYVEQPLYPMDAPFSDPLKNWQATDISCRPAGGQRVLSDADLDVYGGGRDIWNAHDEFRFVWQKVSGRFELAATVESLDEVNEYAKAGIMLRSGVEDGAATLLLNVFPNHQVAVAWREKSGAAMKEKKFPVSQFPLHLRFLKVGNQVDASFSTDGKKWVDAGTYTLDWLSSECCAGLAVLSHDDRYLARGAFRGISIKKE